MLTVIEKQLSREDAGSGFLHRFTSLAPLLVNWNAC